MPDQLSKKVSPECLKILYLRVAIDVMTYEHKSKVGDGIPPSEFSCRQFHLVDQGLRSPIEEYRAKS